MYVRLLGPCSKTGRKPDSHTPEDARGGPFAFIPSLNPEVSRVRRATNSGNKPKLAVPTFPNKTSEQPCLTQRRATGSYPDQRLSSNLDFRFTLDGFHALLAPRTRCFSAFPYGTFALSVTTLSYLALDGQHHPYSASTFKLTYSRKSPVARFLCRSNLTPRAPGNHPRCRRNPRCRTILRLQVPKSAMGQQDSVSGYSLFARSYWGNLY